MKVATACLVALAGLLLVAPAVSPRSGVNVRAAAGVYVADITLSAAGLIFTQVAVNGHEAVALIDSGSYRTIQISSTLAGQLGVRLADTGETTRRYNGNILPVRTGYVDMFALAGYAHPHAEIAVIDGDIEEIGRQIGMAFDVVLGWGFLSRFDVVVDYPSLRIELNDSPIERPHGGIVLGFSVIRNAPTVAGRFGDADVRLLFDTGAPVSRIDVSVARATLGTVVRRDFLVGASVLPLNLRVSDLTVIRQSLGCVGVLGNDLLRTYRVSVSQQQRAISLN